MPPGQSPGPEVGEVLPDFVLPDAGPHMKRLMRKAKKKPLALPRFLWKNIKLEWAARQRAATKTTQGKSE